MMENYDHKTLVEMFDGQNVSPILPYDSIDADVATIEASTQASGRISISGVQPKYAMVADDGQLRFARQGEQGRYILKIAPVEPHIIERPTPVGLAGKVSGERVGWIPCGETASETDA